MDNQQERPGDLDLGWLVGVIESEGCFSLSGSKWRNGELYYNISVIISNTSPALVEKAARILTQGGVGHHVRWYEVERLQKYNRKFRRPMAQITIWGVARVTQLLDLTEGLWVPKRPQAEVARRFTELPRPYKGDQCRALYEQNRAYNKGILTDYTPDPRGMI